MEIVEIPLGYFIILSKFMFLTGCYVSVLRYELLNTYALF